ncbi:fructose-1-6-bisphosphatase-domain-containing protein [Mycena amicta]|nr:fructose-1-6-bisphosphatase-domain-containing protein [Mycena amicta]
MVAAGYTMYGPSANLVLSTGSGVNGYTLDAALGEFILTHPNIKIPSRGKIYSFNEGNSMYFNSPVTAYLKSIKYPPAGNPHTALVTSVLWSPMSTAHCSTVAFLAIPTTRRARAANCDCSTRRSL